MKRICIFASGTGSNAEKIIAHFAESDLARVVLVVSDKPDAGVLDVARNASISTLLINNEELKLGDELVVALRDRQIDLIVLAGFLRLLPPMLLQAFPDKIINIHPSLLPAHGGKGMYGQRVHQAVLNAREDISGITIHYVNELYDDGRVIFQAQCSVLPTDNVSTLAARVLRLEHEHYPLQLEKILQ